MPKTKQLKKSDEPTNLFNAIKVYTKAVTVLAEAMVETKAKLGRKTLEDVTDFDIPRINTLCGIGSLPMELCSDIVPETLTELVGLSIPDVEKYAKAIRKDGLKASAVRKLIRSTNKTVHTKEKKVKVNSWGKQILLLENEIKKMDKDTKQRAIAHLANTITTL
jgi:hypothetical protein